MQNSAPVFLAEHIRAIEQGAMSRREPPALMERAGLAVAELAGGLAGDRTRRILALAGPGNNGGDALIAARHLKSWWFDVRVVFTGDASQLGADARAAHDAWRDAGGTLAGEMPPDFRWDLALDGLFGIGLARDLDARHARLVAALNESGKQVVAIDVPSGLDADTGRVHGAAVRAAHTLTFLGLKAGLFTADGPDHAGEVHLDRLGLEDEPLPDGHGWLIGDEIIAGALPRRSRNAHKGMFGDVGVVGGAPGMVGAALLAGRAALKLGAGRVFVGLLGKGPEVDLFQPDLMLRPAEEILSRERLGCLVLGPGLGQSDAARHALEKALSHDAPLVLDADALNLLAAGRALRAALARRRQPALLTPHPAEAARLLGTTTAQVQRDRVRNALALARDTRAFAVLKGAGSVCVTPEGRWHLNTSGNPGMAVAGMGDVLAGMLGALLAQGAAPEAALLAGVHAHGLAGDELVARGIGPVGLTASETIDTARQVWNRLAAR
ncbi:MAG TPA: NAD(P)H-hydrate dehydratase [Burkholderiales bacterium]|nr:NAD(P)H-hydrate dehydratase [Burkholderiales bacterium]